MCTCFWGGEVLQEGLQIHELAKAAATAGISVVVPSGQRRLGIVGRAAAQQLWCSVPPCVWQLPEHSLSALLCRLLQFCLGCLFQLFKGGRLADPGKSVSRCTPAYTSAVYTMH
jgi:hypothetical protein